jgi:hypothetical protein
MAGVAGMSSALVEADDRWLLPLAGRQVERLCVDFAVTLMFSGGVELRIEQPFVVTSADGTESLVVPQGEPERAAPAVQLARREVERAEAFKDGHLELSFSDGTTLKVPADEGFEAWELVGPDGLRTVSLPGGDLAVWQPETS